MKEIGILCVEQKKYIDKDTGVAYDYLQPYIILEGEKFNLLPMKNQKELFKYLIKKQYNGGN